MTSLVNAIIGNIDKIILAGVQLFVALIKNLPKIIVEIVKAVPQIIAAIVKEFAGGASQMASIGLNLIKGIWNGIGDAASWLWGKVSGFCSNLMSKIKGFFGIHSPSTEMAWVGEMLVEGLAGSIEDNGGEAVKAAEGLSEGISDVMNGLAEDMKTSIPTDFHLDADASVRSVPGKAGVADFGCDSAERTVKVECSVFPQKNFPALVAVLDGMAEWLDPTKGQLILDDVPDRYFMARLS